MIHIVALEEIQGMLLRIPALVHQQEQRDSQYVADVKRWLVELERLFDHNRMPEGGDVAALRGLLISAERGVIPPGVEFQGRSTLRKIREASAAQVLRQAAELASTAIRGDRERVIEAERICRQLVAVARAKGLMTESAGAGQDHAETLRARWRTLSVDPDLAAGTVNVEGLVGPADALIILDRTMVADLPTR